MKSILLMIQVLLEALSLKGSLKRVRTLRWAKKIGLFFALLEIYKKLKKIFRKRKS